MQIKLDAATAFMVRESNELQRVMGRKKDRIARRHRDQEEKIASHTRETFTALALAVGLKSIPTGSGVVFSPDGKQAFLQLTAAPDYREKPKATTAEAELADLKERLKTARINPDTVGKALPGFEPPGATKPLPPGLDQAVAQAAADALLGKEPPRDANAPACQDEDEACPEEPAREIPGGSFREFSEKHGPGAALSMLPGGLAREPAPEKVTAGP